MKAVLFLAVLVLATQARTPVHEFFYDFVSNLKIDASTKSQVLSHGLECLDFAFESVFGTARNIKYDIDHKDILSLLRDALNGAETLQHEALPKCQQVFFELATYVNYNIKYVSREQAPFLYANLISTAAKTFFDTAFRSTEHTAEGLATLFNTAFGFEQIHYPEIPQFDYSRYVHVDEEKAVSAFLKGFFTTLGFNNLAQINATSQCVIGFTSAINDFAKKNAMINQDGLSKLNAFLGFAMNTTAAWERCKRLDTVDLSFVSRLFTSLKRDTLRTMFTIFENQITALPMIAENTMNMQYDMFVGQFEAAGQKYANLIKQEYQHILF